MILVALITKPNWTSSRLSMRIAHTHPPLHCAHSSTIAHNTMLINVLNAYIFVQRRGSYSQFEIITRAHTRTDTADYNPGNIFNHFPANKIVLLDILKILLCSKCWCPLFTFIYSTVFNIGDHHTCALILRWKFVRLFLSKFHCAYFFPLKIVILFIH